MTTDKLQVAILFAGGSYGNFVQWCIDYFAGGNDILPFDHHTGSSHNKQGKFKFSYKRIIDNDNYNFNMPYEIILSHPKVKETDSILNYIFEMLKTSNRKIILLYHTENTKLVSINNKFSKVFKEGWLKYNNSLFSKSTKFGWGKSLDNISKWEMREFLSMMLPTQHESEAGSEEISNINDERVLKITLDELLGNFETTIKKIFDFINLKIERIDFNRIYSEWIKLQFHKDKDKIVKNIIESVINNKFYDWSDSNLTIIDECWIQHLLRDEHGIEIKCYGLDEFPTNTTALREYLI